MSPEERAERVATLLRHAAAHARLVKTLRACFSAEELAAMYDALPDDSGQPMSTLTSAIATAWAGLRDAGAVAQ